MNSPLTRISIVEDEKISGLRLQEHLTAMGHPVDLFLDGESFWESYLHSPL